MDLQTKVVMISSFFAVLTLALAYVGVTKYGSEQ